MAFIRGLTVLLFKNPWQLMISHCCFADQKILSKMAVYDLGLSFATSQFSVALKIHIYIYIQAHTCIMFVHIYKYIYTWIFSSLALNHRYNDGIPSANTLEIPHPYTQAHTYHLTDYNESYFAIHSLYTGVSITWGGVRWTTSSVCSSGVTSCNSANLSLLLRSSR